KLPSIRERSVVRLSVIASTKYSCSGSFDRLANGNTTIDRRSAAFAGALAVAGVDGVVGDHSHQAPSPTQATRTRLVAKAASRGAERRRGATGGAVTVTSGVAATAAVLNASARTGGRCFLTICSPISANA